MRKLFTKVCMTILFASHAYAFVGTDIEFGLGTYSSDLSGHIGYGKNANTQTLDLSNSGLDKEFSNNSYIYIDFAHFIPLVPNLRFERLVYSHSGLSRQNINWNNINYNQDVNLVLNMNQKDLILYWGVPLLETLSLDTFQLNYGIDIKNISGDISLENNKVEFDETIPAFHLDARVSLPMFPLNIEAHINKLTFKDAKIDNSEIKFSGVFDFSGFDGKIDIGYRANTIIIPDDLLKNANFNLSSSGIFIGVSGKF